MIQLAFFYFFSYSSLGCVLSSIIPMLNDSFSSWMKTGILGIGAIFAFVLSFVFGKLSDSLQKIKPSFYISSSFYLLSVIGIYSFEASFMKILSFIGLLGFSRILMSSCETLVYFESEHFGKLHCVGVLGLVCSSLLMNIFSDYRVMICMISICLSIIFIFFYKENAKKKQQLKLNDFISLLKNKEYMQIVFLFFFLMLMGFADQYVVVEKMLYLGASSSLITLKYALQAFVEIPVFLFYGKLTQYFSMVKLLLFCIFMSSIKFIFYGWANTPNLILWVCLLQVFTHPLIILLSKNLISKMTSSHLKTSSQMIGFAIYYGLSGFVAAFLGNLFVFWFSYDITLYIFSSFSIFSFILWKKIKSVLN